VRSFQLNGTPDDLVAVPARALHVEEALGARAAGLVHHHHGLLHQIVLGDHPLDEARHLVGASAGARRHDELHGLVGLPGEHGGERRERRANQSGDPATAENRLLHGFLLGFVEYRFVGTFASRRGGAGARCSSRAI